MEKRLWVIIKILESEILTGESRWRDLPWEEYIAKRLSEISGGSQKDLPRVLKALDDLRQFHGRLVGF